MNCNSCKNISFDNCPTYQDLLEAPHLDFYYEELEKDIPNDTHWEEGDNLMAVIHCYVCGTTRKANGEVVKGGVTKDEMMFMTKYGYGPHSIYDVNKYYFNEVDKEVFFEDGGNMSLTFADSH